MKLEKLYEQLTPEERFRAAISAASRKDGAEWDRLNETSPMRTVVSQEPSYFARVQKLWTLSLLHTSTQRDRFLCGALSLLFLTNLDCVFGQNASDDKRAAADETLATAASIALARARGMERAFDEFTSDLGLDPQEVRSALGMVDDDLTVDLKTIAEFETDEALPRETEEAEKRRWRELLDHIWNRSINEQWSQLERSFACCVAARKK